MSKERGFLLPTNINIEILKYKNAIVTPAYGRMWLARTITTIKNIAIVTQVYDNSIFSGAVTTI